eukprot:tig00000056_g24051.t1
MLRASVALVNCSRVHVPASSTATLRDYGEIVGSLRKALACKDPNERALLVAVSLEQVVHFSNREVLQAISSSNSQLMNEIGKTKNEMGEMRVEMGTMKNELEGRMGNMKNDVEWISSGFKILLGAVTLLGVGAIGTTAQSVLDWIRSLMRS